MLERNIRESLLSKQGDGIGIEKVIPHNMKFELQQIKQLAQSHSDFSGKNKREPELQLGQTDTRPHILLVLFCFALLCF